MIEDNKRCYNCNIQLIGLKVILHTVNNKNQISCSECFKHIHDKYYRNYIHKKQYDFGVLKG